MGVLFNGSQWIDTTAAYNRASSNHSVCYWLRVDSTTGTRRPMGNTGAWEARSSSGSLVLTSDYLQSGTLGTVTLNAVGQFTHVVFVQSVSSSQRFAYKDGVLVGTVNSATFAGAQNAVLSIGESPGGVGQGWNGVIDDIRVYNRVLTAAEVATIYACRGTDGLRPGSLWYPMDEGVEGAVVTNLRERIQGVSGLNATALTGSPVYNYDAGIKRRRVAAA